MKKKLGWYNILHGKLIVFVLTYVKRSFFFNFACFHGKLSGRKE